MDRALKKLAPEKRSCAMAVASAAFSPKMLPKMFDRSSDCLPCFPPASPSPLAASSAPLNALGVEMGR